MRRLIMNGNGKTLLLIISLAFNLGACLAVAVQASGGQPSRPQRRDDRRHRERLTEKLNLSPEQSEILSASRDELFEELDALKRRLHEESSALADLLTASELDMDAVSAQAEKVAAARDEIHWQMVEHLLSIREVLEPDQLESFKEFARKVLSRSGRGRRHGGGGAHRHDPGDRKP